MQLEPRQTARVVPVSRVASYLSLRGNVTCALTEAEGGEIVLGGEGAQRTNQHATRAGVFGKRRCAAHIRAEAETQHYIHHEYHKAFLPNSQKKVGHLSCISGYTLPSIELS